MPLDPLQERIIRTVLALPHARTLALAGGCAVIVHGLVERTTRDVDLFTERDAGEALELCAALCPQGQRSKHRGSNDTGNGSVRAVAVQARQASVAAPHGFGGSAYGELPMHARWMSQR